MTSSEIFQYGKEQHTPAEMLSNPSFSHTRVSTWCCPNRDVLWVYFRCSDSPSGVLQAGSFKLNEETRALMAARNVKANLGPSRGEIAAANPPGTVSFELHGASDLDARGRAI